MQRRGKNLFIVISFPVRKIQVHLKLGRIFSKHEFPEMHSEVVGFNLLRHCG